MKAKEFFFLKENTKASELPILKEGGFVVVLLPKFFYSLVCDMST